MTSGLPTRIGRTSFPSREQFGDAPGQLGRGGRRLP